MSTKTYAEEPAYPDKNNSGLTKREYFAAMALQGLLSDPEDYEMEGEEEGEDMEEEGMDGEMEGEAAGPAMENKRRPGESCTECCCRLAVEHADMLINQLNK